MTRKYNEWHLRDAEATASQLKVETARGLDEREVIRRRRRNGKNTVWHVRRSSASEYASNAAVDLVSILLIIAAITAAIFEGDPLARSVCAVLAVGVLIRTVTYVKARRILEELADEGIPSATVLRGGSTRVLRADELVEGDIVLLGPGDVVPCDGRIFLGDNIKVTERGITENRQTVIKGDTVILTDSGKEVPCEFRVNMLFAGSTVLAGRCRIIATACGDDTLVSMRHGGLLISSGESLPVTEKLSVWCRNVRLVLLAFVAVISAFSLFTLYGDSMGLDDVFSNAVALATSSAAGYLSTSGYITLTIPLRRASIGDVALGERRKKGKDGENGEKPLILRRGEVSRSIVHDVSCIEDVAGVRCIVAGNVSAFKSGRSEYSCYYMDGDLHEASDGDVNAWKLLSFALTTVCAGEESMGLSKDELRPRRRKLALLESCAAMYRSRAAESGKKEAHAQLHILDHDVTEGASGDTDTVIVLRGQEPFAMISGPVKFVLSCCEMYRVGRREYPLSSVERGRIAAAAERAEARGGVVIAMAERSSPYSSLRRLSVVQSRMCFVGFAAIYEEAEPETLESASLLRDSGMRVVVLSDNPRRDRRYLERCGVYGGGEAYVSSKSVMTGNIPDGSFSVWVPRSKSSDSVSESLRVRLAVTKKLADSISGVGVITSEPNESAMFADGVVGSAVSGSRSRPIPQSLKRRAKISVYPAADEGCGGFGGTVRTVAASVCALENLRRASIFTLLSQGARLACVVLSVIVGMGITNVASILLLGMIFDFLSVLAISFGRERRGVLDGNPSERQIPGLRESLVCSFFGILTGTAAFGFALLGGRLVFGSAECIGEMTTTLTVSMLLSQLALLLMSVSRGKVRGQRGDMALPAVFALGAAAAALLICSNSVAAFFGGSCLPWQMSLVSLAAPVFTSAVMIAAGLIKNKFFGRSG